MVKITTLVSRRKYSKSIHKSKTKPKINPKRIVKIKNFKGLEKVDPLKTLTDEKLVAQAIWECLKDNDPEALIEIVQIHLEAVNKVKASENVHLPRSTLYNAFKGKNPTLKTLAKMVNCFSK